MRHSPRSLFCRSSAVIRRAAFLLGPAYFVIGLVRHSVESIVLGILLTATAVYGTLRAPACSVPLRDRTDDAEPAAAPSR